MCRLPTLSALEHFQVRIREQIDKDAPASTLEGRKEHFHKHGKLLLLHASSTRSHRRIAVHRDKVF